MTRLGLLFLVAAFMAALLGFGWVADLSYPSAQAACIVFTALAALSFLAGVLDRGKFQDAS